MKKVFLKIGLLLTVSLAIAAFNACNDNPSDDGTDDSSNSSKTGSVTVYNKTSASNPRTIRSIRVYNSSTGVDKWNFTDISRNGSRTISGIPAGTYTVQAEFANKYEKKTGVKVTKGKTTSVSFQ